MRGEQLELTPLNQVPPWWGGKERIAPMVTESLREGLRGMLRGLPGPTNSDAYTPEEVRARLRLDPLSDPRTAAVHDAAGRTGEWTALLPTSVAQDLGRTASRLPAIVFWYRCGLPVAEIGRRLSPFGGAWDGDRAIAAAADLVAEFLNCRRPAEELPNN